MRRLIFLYLGFVLLAFSTSAQDSIKVSNFKLSGYVKYLETQNFDNLSKSNLATHLLHNRLRFKWNVIPKMTIQAEVRNRVFWGTSVESNPYFVQYLSNSNDFLNLSGAWLEQSGWVGYSTFDRLFVDWKGKNQNIRIGRQRINWGISSIWNPNDIFNAYNFLDVDYEERPGSDAIKYQRNWENLSSLDVVYARTGKSGSIAAAKYFFNKWNFDFQAIAGKYQEVGTFGIGFAGSWGDAGLKGEIQHYLNSVSILAQTNATLGIDYMFSKGWYVSSAYLYNSLGITEPLNFGQSINLNLSSRNLMPTKHNVLLMGSKQLSPLSTLSLTSIYAPGTKLLIGMPSFSYSLSNQMELNLFWQSFWMSYQSEFRSISNVLMGRIRWSF